jgi:hypothetical protein
MVQHVNSFERVLRYIRLRSRLHCTGFAGHDISFNSQCNSLNIYNGSNKQKHTDVIERVNLCCYISVAPGQQTKMSWPVNPVQCKRGLNYMLYRGLAIPLHAIQSTWMCDEKLELPEKLCMGWSIIRAKNIYQARTTNLFWCGVPDQ